MAGYGSGSFKCCAVLIAAASLFLAAALLCPAARKICASHGGYYYADYVADKENYLNTNNLEEIGGRLQERSERIDFDFNSSKGDLLYLKVVYGRELSGIQAKEMNYLSLKAGKGITFEILPDNAEEKLFKAVNRDGEGICLTLERRNAPKDAIFIRSFELSVLPAAFNFNLSRIIFIAVFPLLLFLFFGRSLKSGKFTPLEALVPLGLLALLLLAAQLRWEEFARTFYQPPNNDMLAYYAHALKMRLFSPAGFYAAGLSSRADPFFPFLINRLFSVFTPGPAVIKLLTLGLSLGMVMMTYWISLRIFESRAIGLLSAFLIAVNKGLIMASAQGLRTELEAILLILLAYILFVGPKRLDLKFLLALATVSCLWFFTRSHSLLCIVALSAIGIFARRKESLGKRALYFACAMAAVFIVILPLVIGQFRSGCAYGLSGYVTEHAINENLLAPDTPAKISVADYLIKYHPPSFLLLAPAAGMALVNYNFAYDIFNLKLAANHLLKSLLLNGPAALAPGIYFNLFLFAILIFYGFSLLLILRDGRYRFMLYVCFFTVLYLSYIYGLNVLRMRVIVGTARTTQHLLPFIAGIVSFGIFAVLKKAYSKIWRQRL